MIANKILFCDTDVITTQIYSQHYLQTIPEILFELENQINYDLYFLLDIDIEWVADDLRDMGHRRTEMYTLFKKELDKRDIKYLEVKGNYEARELLIRKAIDNLLNLVY